MLDYQRVKPLNTRVSSNGSMESQSSNTCWTAGRGYFHWSSVLEDRSTCFTASMYMCLIHLDLIFLEIEGAIYLQLLLNSLRWRWRERDIYIYTNDEYWHIVAVFLWISCFLVGCWMWTTMTGWWWLEHLLFSQSVDDMSSSQLTWLSYFSEAYCRWLNMWLNHQMN